MRKRILVAIAVAGAVVLATGGAIAVAGSDDSEEGVTGPAADRAASAALEATGGGTVQGVEPGDGGEAAWEVEVTRPDGTSVEVLLDAGFGLVATEGEADDDGGDAGEDTGG